MISQDFMYCQYTVDDKEELFDRLSDDLMKQGIVKDGFSQALKDREEEFPTGLPVKHGVAIPHTDGALVNNDQLIFATLTKPIVFNEMGGDDEDTIDVSVIVMLAIKDGPKHLDVLQKLIESIQKEGFINGLAAAKKVDEMMGIVNGYLSL
ncbi:PTS sugar transporter subunit IIA [Enterococcus hulanensis]|uniref:PTS sugar transporter subunit IIA n=1 Tax=Enterococcus hulanensis TaxID=2559929 RepID=UPI001A8F55E0|nr:PTS sugar transporter subunit IIA [Enterococcus hulanensis]MBO0457125.1 PTS sugar transporter subunit IIA [Enterococcus hulanensis]